MNNSLLKKVFSAIFLLATFSLWGCMGVIPIKAQHIDPNFEKNNISHLNVLPIFDARKDKSIEIDLNSFFKKPIKTELTDQREYTLSFSNHYGRIKVLDEDDLEDAKPNWVKLIGDYKNRWNFLIVVEDLQNISTFGAMASAELTGLLFDNVDGRVIWTHKSSKRIGHGGLIALAMQSFIHKDALLASMNELLRSFPKKGEKPFDGSYETSQNSYDFDNSYGY